MTTATHWKMKNSSQYKQNISPIQQISVGLFQSRGIDDLINTEQHQDATNLNKNVSTI